MLKAEGWNLLAQEVVVPDDRPAGGRPDRAGKAALAAAGISGYPPHISTDSGGTRRRVKARQPVPDLDRRAFR